MKSAKLIHNPKAGEGSEVEHKIISSLLKAGYTCSYSSTKEEGWEKLESGEEDFVVIAGGDGTVRKVVFELLNKRLPIGLIPMGTANNIAKTLELPEDADTIIQGWDAKNIKSFDIGRIYNLKEEKFFIEGLGFGVFPKLMRAMEKESKKEQVPDKKLRTALELLHDIILEYEERPCRILIDDAEYTGSYLMAEVMNTRSIGPNLNLVPFADPGDGEFEVVLIAAAQREQFANYILSKILGKEEPAFFNILKAKKLKIYWEGVHLHVDDAYIKLAKATEIKIELQEDAVRFLK
ncbi:MAG TPA: diacylglycerol kinase family protein [Ohtaekwangia sp.]|uniref:diacylglycerol/lipid kinase family protein n=1 Tax=Ohtaekwangia sp. TaxID=2066019 RepID=UPI002F959363